MQTVYSKKYWKWGFCSKLYDALTPESYRESLRQVVRQLPKKSNLTLLDVGCGSGLLVDVFKEQGIEGIRYLATDVLDEGVAHAWQKATQNFKSGEALCFRSDLERGLAVKERSLDVAVAHFSLYTLSDDSLRNEVFRDLYKSLKPGGRLICVNPSIDYDPKNIIEESLDLLVQRKNCFLYGSKRFLVYPLTFWFGLKFIYSQLRSGNWRFYTREEIKEVLQKSGFKINSFKPVYAGSGIMVVATAD